jgi:hypothetical protein
MAAYPTLPITQSSVKRRLDGFVAIRSTNGTLKMRKMMGTDKHEFEVQHELTGSNKTNLENHYSADKLNSFSFTWVTGESYTAKYMVSPQYREMQGGWFKATVRLGEV